MKVRATVAYDGSGFAGFQRQRQARTVQGEIEAALERVLGRPTPIVASGRTDAGVHAVGQVIAFEVEQWSHSLALLQRALNAELPADIAIRALQPCAPDFHPRYSALSRTYEYTVYVDPVRHPLRRYTAWWLAQKPDVARMNQAATYLLGEHDFAAFGRAMSERGRASTVRRVFRASWRESAPDELRFVIEANAFLFHMVRRIVKALVNVGLGLNQPEDVKQMLEARDAQRIKGLAPACGLCLVHVKYPGEMSHETHSNVLCNA
ncbi:MAG: tRNA pseudouridine(38-40) synthase TruA [Anaerolineae bacterium]|nr:tRNA pseudouridine(38-40) synthase TruA [Thermoflexales bacterium]MDW8053846.1 tRNA pseudouridine(38-40) synthase TruA [Anaerolineae bacterium]MDW8292377.1 tRNA pseudouridine(38-40) synthase TruA [Anaerolineae bacterium]